MPRKSSAAVAAVSDAHAELDQAFSQLQAGDPTGALETMLAVWRTRPLSHLAERIEALSKAMLAQQPGLPPEGGREGTRQFVLLARHATASDIGPLLIDFERALSTGLTRLAVPRIEELLRLPRDPRISTELLVELQQLRVRETSYNMRFWNRFKQVLVLQGDPRAAGPVQAALGRLTGEALGRWREAEWLRGQLEKWVARLPVAPLPTEAEQEVLRALTPDAIGARPAPKRPALVVSETELLAAIHRSPGDDAHRLVYADWLAERGDPRGEFISLQCAARSDDAAAAKRADALLKAHGRKWLGRLDGEVFPKTMRFRRGFLAFARPMAEKVSEAEATFARPEWATVEEIEFFQTALFSDQMRSLRIATQATDMSVRRLKELAAPLASLHKLHVDVGYDGSMARALASVAKTDKLPALRELELTGAQVPDSSPALLARLPAQLETLWIHAYQVLETPLDAWLEALTQAKGGLSTLVVADDQVRVTLSGDRLQLAYEPNAHPGWTKRWLAGLERNRFQRLELVMPESEDNEVAAALRAAAGDRAEELVLRWDVSTLNGHAQIPFL
jgi:uncharacterized protein (TIGR02996 family)